LQNFLNHFFLFFFFSPPYAKIFIQALPSRVFLKGGEKMYSDKLTLSNQDLELIRDFNKDYTLADTQYEIIMQEIQDFEEDLDDNHEVALKLCHFGQNILLNVTDIGIITQALFSFMELLMVKKPGLFST